MDTASINAGQRFAEGEGRHEDRRAVTLLVGAFLTDFYALAADGRLGDGRSGELARGRRQSPHPAGNDASRVGTCHAWSQTEGDT
jgi:hypothetical protein